ncbi:hypothetical protein DBR07_04535 [Aeromonas sp. HMWF036]|nr:hypothetical protein DBR07_04535 [Aeromonas sp. HMWF036]PTT30271.1 hypothetical protein DBR30_05245 [Aeromonas sp. HMWF017]
MPPAIFWPRQTYGGIVLISPLVIGAFSTTIYCRQTIKIRWWFFVMKMYFINKYRIVFTGNFIVIKFGIERDGPYCGPVINILNFTS